MTLAKPRGLGAEPGLAAVVGSSSAASAAARLDRRLRAAEVAAPALASGVEHAAEPVDLELANEHREAGVLFYQLPSCQSLLTVGSEAIYQLSVYLHEKLIALDATAKAVKGALRACSFVALQIAETGHLAMGTVHAHLTSNIIPRLTNDQIGVSRHALTGPNVLILLAYQALVPKLCRCCALTTSMAMRVDPDAREIEDVLRRRFGVATSRLKWIRPEGCLACQGRGTCGKTIVAEMLQPDRPWLRHVRNTDDDAALQHFRSNSNRQFDSPHMTGKTVFEHALYKAPQGEIDVRDCEEFDGFERFEILPREEQP